MKSLKAIALTIILATAGAPKKSEAAIGLATGVAPLVIAGIAVPVGATAAAGLAEIIDGGGRHQGMFTGIILIITLPIGLLLLDGEEEQAIEYEIMDKDMANDLGVTNAEMASYNAELDQANVLLEEVAMEVERIEKPSADVIRATWKKYQEFVSPETFSALEKIGHQFAQQ